MRVLRLRAWQQDRPGTVTFLLKGFLGEAVPVAFSDSELNFFDLLFSSSSGRWDGQNMGSAALSGIGRRRDKSDCRGL